MLLEQMKERQARRVRGGVPGRVTTAASGQVCLGHCAPVTSRSQPRTANDTEGSPRGNFEMSKKKFWTPEANFLTLEEAAWDSAPPVKDALNHLYLMNDTVSERAISSF